MDWWGPSLWPEGQEGSDGSERQQTAQLLPTKELVSIGGIIHPIHPRGGRSVGYFNVTIGVVHADVLNPSSLFQTWTWMGAERGGTFNEICFA